MSTIFAVKKEGIEFDINNNDTYTEVAFRSAGIRWTSDVAYLLPRGTKVFPTDNTAQGIKTIGDIIDEINGVYE